MDYGGAVNRSLDFFGDESRKGIPAEEAKTGWDLLSSHGMVLLHLSAGPGRTQRDLSDALGITERQVGRIIGELRDAGMLRSERRGRRNIYTIDPDARMRHPTLSHLTIGELVSALAPVLKREAKEPGRPVRYRSEDVSGSG